MSKSINEMFHEHESWKIKDINKPRRPRIRTELLVDIAKDLEHQKLIIEDICKLHYGMHNKQGPKIMLLDCLIHKTEINLEMLKRV